jgi:hypothetical protein
VLESHATLNLTNFSVHENPHERKEGSLTGWLAVERDEGGNGKYEKSFFPIHVEFILKACEVRGKPPRVPRRLLRNEVERPYDDDASFSCEKKKRKTFEFSRGKIYSNLCSDVFYPRSRAEAVSERGYSCIFIVG